jgi:hypothetical protein
VSVSVSDGVVDLRGVISDERLREAIRVCAENIPGVKAVHDHLTLAAPYTPTFVKPDVRPIYIEPNVQAPRKTI